MKNADRGKKVSPVILAGFLSLFLFSGPPLSGSAPEGSYAEYFSLGEKHRLAGEFEISREFFEKALEISRKEKLEKEELKALLKLGIIHWNTGRLKESTHLYSQALDLARKLRLNSIAEECQAALEIYKLYTEGKDFRDTGDFHSSIESFEKAIDLARRIASPEHELKCLRQMSLTHWFMNNMEDYCFANEKALIIARKINHFQEEGRCLNNIGLYYWKIDNYIKALANYEKALEIAHKTENTDEQAICLSNIGAIYIDMGNFDKALEYLFEALMIDEKLGDFPNIGKDFNNIGEAFRRKGLITGDEADFHQALNYFAKSLEIANKSFDKKTEIKVLNNMGAVYTHLEKYRDALNHFQSGFLKAKDIDDIEAMSMILNNMGIVHFHLGNYEESTRYYQQAIDLALEIRGGQILWEAYLEMANAHARQGKYEDALKYYKNSIAVIEDIRSNIKLEELKASYLGTDKRIEAYHNLIDLLVRLHESSSEETYAREAFRYLEKAKARAFLDSLEVSEVRVSQGIDLKLANQERELMADISRLFKKLLIPELSAEQKKEISDEILKAEESLEALKREIRMTSPAYADLKYPEIINLEEAQAKLVNKDTVFFVYSIGRDHSYGFAITRNDLKIFPVPARNEVQKKVADYLKAISDRENHDFSLGYELFCDLVLPGLDRNARKLIFIPDDILTFLPFETLLTSAAGNEWLIKNHKIAYAPSLTSLREIIKRKKANDARPRKDLLALGDPAFGVFENEGNGTNGGDVLQGFFSSPDFNLFRLKYSGLEVEKIAALFKQKRTHVLTRESATEEKLKKQNLEDYRILHFATHALIDNKKPVRSSIILSLDQDLAEDGFLQMREVFNLRLNADLVVLSACQTGLGQFIRGEGIEGLNRAFFYAGASSVLMSMWAINDQASYQLMERFYAHLRSSRSIMDALQKAKLELIHSDVLSHPYYWAGFIVAGKTEKVIFPRRMNPWILLILAFCSGVGIWMAAKGIGKNSRVSR